MTIHTHRWASPARPWVVRLLVALVPILALAPGLLQAQTDYYNTDAGRPLAIEDATPLELRAIELQVAPMRLARARGATEFGIEPELALGLLPRTHLEIAIPLSFSSIPGEGNRSTTAGLTVAALHALNVETGIPALAVGGSFALIGGAHAVSQATAKAILTRTLPQLRMHLNAQYSLRTGGSAADEAAHGDELSRWMSGVAVDHTFPLMSTLVGAELTVRQPAFDGAAAVWSTAAGLRHQLAPRASIDGGVGVRLSGSDRGWFLTAGLAVQLRAAWRIDR